MVRVLRYDVEWGRPFGGLTYRRSVLAANPIGYWKLDDASGTTTARNEARDAADAAVTGVVFGEATPVAAGYGSTRAEFDGASYLTVSAATFNAYFEGWRAQWEGVSVIAWAERDALDTGGYLVVKGTETASPDDLEFALGFELDGSDYKVKLSTSDSLGAEIEVVGATTIAVGENRMIAATAGMENVAGDMKLVMRVYVDGVLDGTYTHSTTGMPGFFKNDADLTIGSREDASAESGEAFAGLIDEVAVFGYALSPSTIYELFRLGTGRAVPEPDEDWDTDAVELEALETTSLTDVIEAGEPTHWYKFGEADGASTCVDSGTLAANGSYNGSAGSNDVPGLPLDTTDDVARTLSNADYMSVAGGLTFQKLDDSDPTNQTYESAVAGDVLPLTVGFWFETDASSSDRDGVLGNANSDSRRGFRVTHRNRVLTFELGSTGDENLVSRRVSTPALTEGERHYIVFKTSGGGVLQCYTDGSLVAEHRCADGIGYEHTTSTFRVGRVTGANDMPAFTIDELEIYQRELTRAEIQERYQKGWLGKSAGTRVVDADGDETTFAQVREGVSQLTNETDITQYIEGVEGIAYATDQLIPSCNLLFLEPWSASDLRAQYLKANTYVKVQERILSNRGDLDTGWLDVGHFLVSGPVGETIDTENGRISKIQCQGLLKLAGFDFVNRRIEPDIVPAGRRALEKYLATVDVIQYKCVRDGAETWPKDNPERYYNNWAAEPRVKLYVTDFQNLDDPDDEDELDGVYEANEIVPLKNTTGAVQILYGDGMVRIDTDYYNAKFSAGGIGQPDTFEADFVRYLGPDDVLGAEPDLDPVAVTSIGWDRLWYIEVDADVYDRNGKTLIVRSGDAKGTFYKIRDFSGGVGASSYFSTAAQSANAGPGLTQRTWSNVSNALTKNNSFATISGSASKNMPVNNTYAESVSQFLDVTLPDFGDVDPDAVVNAVRVRVRRGVEGEISTSIGGWRSLGPTNVKVQDQTVRLLIGGVANGDNKALTANDWRVAVSGAYQEVAYGSSIDDWNITGGPYTVGDLESSGFGVRFAVHIDALEVAVQGVDTFEIGVDSVEIELFLSSGGSRLYIVDVNGKAVAPATDGLAVGDHVQIGFAASPSDVVRFVLAKVGFQESDPAAPFYMEIENAAFDGVVLPPTNLSFDAENDWLEYLTDVLQQVPPDYKVVQKRDGSLLVRSIGVDYAAAAIDDADVNLIDVFGGVIVDNSDVGLTTSVVAHGRSVEAANVALNAAARAYLLDNFAQAINYGASSNDVTSRYGVTLTQAQADVVVAQVLDSNPNTPKPTGGRWAATDVGVIWQQYAQNRRDMNKYSVFADVDLFGVDIGRPPGAAKAYNIGEIELIWVNTYYKGNSIPQSMQIYYMTEDDYIAVEGVLPPDEPNQDDTSYFPPADHPAWRLLVDEFIFDSEGAVTLSKGDFIDQRATKLRFLKFRSRQAHFRLWIPDDTSDQIARIVLSGLKVWTDNELYAVAEMGSSPRTNSGTYKALARRLRRRRQLLPRNPLLTTYSDVFGFAETALVEAIANMESLRVEVLGIDAQPGDVVFFAHPYTGQVAKYAVREVQVDYGDGMHTLELVNYDISETRIARIAL